MCATPGTPRTSCSVSWLRCGAAPVRVYSRQPGSASEPAPLRPSPTSEPSRPPPAPSSFSLILGPRGTRRRGTGPPLPAPAPRRASSAGAGGRAPPFRCHGRQGRAAGGGARRGHGPHGAAPAAGNGARRGSAARSPAAARGQPGAGRFPGIPLPWDRGHLAQQGQEQG